MRKLVIDFDLIFLWPSIVFALIVLLTSMRTYFWPSGYYWEYTEEGEEPIEGKRSRREEKWQARDLLWFSVVALLVLGAVMLMSDRWKTSVANEVWKSLELVSEISFVISALTAWHYAEKQERLKLVACLLAMWITAAGAEHFHHQAINTGHMICPHCTDDDQPDDAP